MILLFSGGLDSFIAYHYLNKPKTLYVNLGHRYAVHEIEVVRKLVPDTAIDNRLNLAEFERRDANIPLRNVLLVSVASYYDKDVVLVVQKGEMNIPDRSPYFFNEYARFLTCMWGDRVTLTTPFFNMTKTEMVRWYMNNVKIQDSLLSTRSCYSAGDLPCGNCSACFRRWVALTNNDLSEEYENDITQYPEIPKYVEKMKHGRYDPVRSAETLDALRKVGIT
jgi:7-cyano-7-deazaguanine synthase in queuosine biosynthesis